MKYTGLMWAIMMGVSALPAMAGDAVLKPYNPASELTAATDEAAITPRVRWQANCVFLPGNPQSPAYALYDGQGHVYEGVIPSGINLADRQAACNAAMAAEGCELAFPGALQGVINVNVYLSFSNPPVSPVDAPHTPAPASIPWSQGRVKCLS